MTKRKKVASTAVFSAVSFAVAGMLEAQKHPERPTYKYEKCYGVAKAGKNDCFSPSHSCGGTSKADAEKDAWIYVPVGTCEKIVGGILDKNADPEKKGDKKKDKKDDPGE